jgi:hypothetical protein
VCDRLRHVFSGLDYAGGVGRKNKSSTTRARRPSEIYLLSRGFSGFKRGPKPCHSAEFQFIQAAGGLSSTLIRARSPHEWLPKGADLILNKASGAPGFWIGSVIVMAGVPSVMQAMLDEVDRPSHALGNRARIRARRRHRNATRRDRPSIDNNGCSKGLRSNSLARTKQHRPPCRPHHILTRFIHPGADGAWKLIRSPHRCAAGTNAIAAVDQR